MMKKLLLLTLISALVLGVADNLMAQKPRKRKDIRPAVIIPEPIPEPEPEVIFIPRDPIIDPYDWKIGDPHTVAWHIIDSLSKRGDVKVPTRMADSLYTLSLIDRDPIQIVKAVNYQQKFMMQADENGFVKAVRVLEKQIDEVPFIAKQILLLLLAERYEVVYYDNNLDLLYKIRRESVDPPKRRGLKEASEIINLYNEALNDEHNKDIPIAILKDLFGDTQIPNYLQGATLYDYIAWQKLAYMQDTKTYLNIPEYEMGLKDEMVFASAESFALHMFEPGRANTFYKAMVFYQELTKRYLGQPNQLMRQDLDLRRMEFVYEHARMENKGALYEAAIKREMARLEQDSVYTEWAYLLAKYHYDLGCLYNSDRKEGPNRFDWMTAHDIAEAAIKQYPKSRGAIYCQNLKAVIETVSLDITTESVYPLDKPMLVHVGYRNAPKVYCRLLYANEAQSHIVTDCYNEAYGTTDLERYARRRAVLNLPSVETWSINLTSNGDYRQHDTEIKVNAQSKAGLYVLAISLDSTFKETSFIEYSSFSLSNLAYNYCDNNAHLNLQVYDRVSGKPLSGVGLMFYEEGSFEDMISGDKAVVLKRKKSNAKGLLSIKEQDDDFDIRLSKGKDYLNFYQQYNDINSDEKETETDTKTLFFLDRAIYRPGQAVYFKGLAIEQDAFGHRSKVLANTTHKITLYDANGQVLATQEVKTNEYGTFHGEFKLPASGALGEMRISADDDYYRGSIEFKVEEYKRPKFEVSCEVVKGLHLVNDKVSIKGKAMAFAGSSIDDGQVVYSITRQIKLPYWYRWSRKANLPNTYKVDLESGEVETAVDGSFEFDFIASIDSLATKNLSPTFIYTINVDVTDAAGETHSSECTVNIAYHALVMNIEIEDGQNLSDLKDIKISTRNLDGESIFAQGTVLIEELDAPKRIFKERLWERKVLDQVTMSEAEFNANFPTMLFAHEDKIDSWKVKRQVTNTSFDTKQSDVLKLGAKEMLTAGTYKITLESKDPNGDTIRAIKYIYLYDTKKKSMPAMTDLLVKVEKGAYEPGEKALIYVGSSFEEAYAFYSLEHEGILIMQGFVKVNGIAKITIPILEKYRGGVVLHVVLNKDNRTYTSGGYINVPFSNKNLAIEYTTFRNKLLPGQDEEWQVKISGPDGDKVAAEVLANMYDASLDEFAANIWDANIYEYSTNSTRWRKTFLSGNTFSNYWQSSVSLESSKRKYPRIAGFSLYSILSMYFDNERYELGTRLSAMSITSVGYATYEWSANASSVVTGGMPGQYGDIVPVPEIFDNVKVRTNLNETVFFKPDLLTDKDGNVIIKFKMNEALTRWKLMLLAVTKDLKIGYSERFVVTQKDLMVTPNAPRFLRENDVIEFSAKVDNMTKVNLKGEAKLELYDALTMQPIDALLGNTQAVISFEAQAGQSAPLRWQLKLPDGGLSAVTYRVLAKSGDFSDGEENTLPVISDRMFLTETLPLSVRGSQSKVFNFKRMAEVTQSKTAKGEKLTLEFTSNPTWLAIQSMGYLMQYPHECTEQLFSRFYGNALAYSIIATHPKIKQVFDTWKKDGGEAFTSNLLKNPELQLALIEETPWVLDAKDQEIQKKQLGLLFDLGRMGDELDMTIEKLVKRQNYTGGFSWYPDMGDDTYITSHVIEGFGRLNSLGIKVFTEYPKTKELVTKAIKYADDLMLRSYKELKAANKLKQDNLGWTMLEYLYARSFYLVNSSDNLYLPLDAESKVAYEYYLDQVVEYWSKRGLYAEGLMAITLHRAGRIEGAQTLVKVLRNKATIDEDLGMHWEKQSGYYWYQSNIEMHVLMLEVFDEIAKDAQAIDGIKTYLLKNRQGTSWPTTKSTSAAIYGLLLHGDDWLEEDKDVKITLGNTVLDQSKIKKEAGTGYFKTSWNAAEVKPEMANVMVENPNKNVAWGAMYWQYFEDYDKVTSFRETPLKLSKQLYRRVNTDDGVDYTLVTDTTVLRVGDLVEVRISLEATQDMEYVHLKDMRAACFEPLNVLSAYKYQGGIGYYESTRDLNTSFFMGALRKGQYKFSYPLRVTHRGNFSNGVSIIQSMYAPEFTSHSEGMRVTVK